MRGSTDIEEGMVTAAGMDGSITRGLSLGTIRNRTKKTIFRQVEQRGYKQDSDDVYVM